MIALVLLGLVAVSGAYNGIKTAVEARRYPPPGAMVDIGGYRLHLLCEGSGPRLVILDAGAGAWSFMMGRLQRQLRDSVRVCAYDRAALGWSDEAPHGPDVASSVEDLRRLVTAAGLPKPFVLVGHSLGANIAQVYAATHPDDLAGTILLDPARQDDMLSDFEGSDSAAAAIDGCGWKCTVATGAAWTGLARLGALSAGRKNLTPEERAVYRAGIVRAKVVRTTIATLEFLPKIGIQTRAARAFGDVPVTIMYSENTRNPSGRETADSVRIWHANTLDSMRVLLQGTTHPRGPIVLPAVSHTSMILDERARALIVEEVLRLARPRDGQGQARKP
jgi:pimeloyl-ACP methyl ester carboxylesterase